MRSANSTTTIHQTLTPEAATILTHSIADAVRRCHTHTTPLHVAAALLASPSGFLRQSCIASRPNSSSHPLQCRALDLCFSVALERLPRLPALSSYSDESPPLSNALAAALKRAQAHQRRGCPEQLNQPLLAVKVELDQLVVSILDDPSVSRVMREAGFSSPAAKSAVKNTLIPRNPGRSPYSNPRLHNRQPNSGKQSSRDEYVNRVIEVLSKSRKRNPILVGESEPEPVLREVIRKIGTRELGEPLSSAEVVSVKDLGSARLKELGVFVLRRMMDGGNLVVDLGDLKWLVEQTHEAVEEMGKIIGRFSGGGYGGRVWVIGSGTCETYFRCQLYHPNMETHWDLQTISVVATAPLPSCVDHGELEKAQKQLPQWLKNATAYDSGVKSTSDSSQIKGNDPMLKLKSEELMKKWNDRYPKSTPTTPLSSTTNPNLLARQPCKPKTNRLGDDLSLNINSLGSPVRTGQTKTTQESATIDKPLDADSFKKLLKGLIEQVCWQRDAASAIATTVTRCKQRHGGGARGDIWLLFSGPDRTGKKKMASALSELVCGSAPAFISLGSRQDGEESAMSFRGMTLLNRIAEAIRRNPFSVIMLQDIDEADMLFRGSIKRAMERGRFIDSYGREISLGNIIFVVTVNKPPPSSRGNDDRLDEEKLVEMVRSGWWLKLSVDNNKAGKRDRIWIVDEEDQGVSKQRSFDLNEIADGEEERLDKSHNSSDLTEEKGNDNMYSPTSESGDQLFGLVDGCIEFNPVEFGVIRENIEKTVTARFRAVFEEKMLVRIESEVIDRILGEVWLGSNGLDSWAEKVLGRTIYELRSRLFDLPVASVGGSMVARLELDDKYEEGGESNGGNWLPSRINVLVLGEEMIYI